MRIIRIVAVVCFTVLAAGCMNPFSTSAVDGVVVRQQSAGVTIRNDRSADIYYVVMDASFAARALWGPCVRPDCPSIAPGARVTVDSTQIAGWRESDQLIAFWWQRVPAAAGGFEADSVRAVPLSY